MTRSRWLSPVVVAIAVGIGCSGGPSTSLGAPQEASAKTDAMPSSEPSPMQLAQRPAEAAPAGGSSTVRGTVRLNGSAPTPTPVKMSADLVCQQQHASPVMTEEVVVSGQGRLKNVFVYVKAGVAGTHPAPAAPVVLDQQGCWYTPHVFGVQVGQPLEIVNSDATMHNVNAKPARNPPFNIAQPKQGMKMTKTFSKPELGVKFKCNVHPWMSAYAGVVEHPFFAVSEADGSFAIRGLPAGTYVLEAWHEKYGTQMQSVTVSDGESKSIEFTFTVQ